MKSLSHGVLSHSLYLYRSAANCYIHVPLDNKSED